MPAAGVGLIGDTAYLGAARVRPGVTGATPRRKPRGKPRPPEDRRYNQAVSRRRVKVEPTIRRLRVFQTLTQVNRHGRKKHEQRVRAASRAGQPADRHPARDLNPTPHGEGAEHLVHYCGGT